MAKEKFKCCICGMEVEEYGNNPQSVKQEGKCCELCNMLIVIPKRLTEMAKEPEEETTENVKERIVKILEKKDAKSCCEAIDLIEQHIDEFEDKLGFELMIFLLKESYILDKVDDKEIKRFAEELTNIFKKYI